MRELHGWHGDHGRHARDGHAAADHPVTRAHDGPKHAAHDSPKLRMLLDPEARKAERLKYQQKVEATEADYVARHVKPRGSEAKPDQALAESRDKLNSRITGRRDSLESQEADRSKPQRSRLPRADAVKGLTDIAATIAGVAVALGDIPSKWDAVAVLAAGAVVSNLTWAHRRWKDRHGDRSEG